MLVSGGSVLSRRKSSRRSRFWDDVLRWDCTLFQYIGELCRYLVNAPPHPQRARPPLAPCLRQRAARAISGGRSRSAFAIPHIIEFYAATEGDVSLYNVQGKPGAIGQRAGVPRASFSDRDRAAAMPMRGELCATKTGSASAAAPDEPGEALGQIGDAEARRAARFEGYTSAAAARRKDRSATCSPRATHGSAPAT